MLYFFKQFRKKEKEKSLTRNRLVKLESEANLAMMKPHFVFNVLNSIRLLADACDSFT